MLLQRVLLGLFALISSSLWSQVTIKGKVQDGITGELIEKAQISAGTVTVESDKNGFYELKVPMGSYMVKATAEGFADGVINIEADRTVISLSVSSFFITSNEPLLETVFPGKNFSEFGFGVTSV